MLTVISVMCLWASSQAIVMQYHCFVRLVSHLNYQLCSIAFSLFEQGYALQFCRAALCIRGRAALCNTAEPSRNTPQICALQHRRAEL